MVRPTDERFPKCHRIRKRAEYLEIQRSAAVVHGRLLVGLVRRADAEGPTRLGITTTKKLGSAVIRNRAKRLVREVFRRNKPPGGLDIVVIPRREMIEADYAHVEADFLSTLTRRGAKTARREPPRPKPS